MRKIAKIVVHHTATPSTVSADQIRAAHLQRGFTDIGYHFLITESGEWVRGRPMSRIGAHVRGHNLDSIGIAVIGDFRHSPVPEAQQQALFRLLSQLRSRYPSARIYTHRELAPTQCPGDQLHALVVSYRLDEPTGVK